VHSIYELSGYVAIQTTILAKLNGFSSYINDVIPCSLMYGAEDPSIAGMVLDSPFSDLVDLMMELVDTYKVRLPKFTVSILYYFFWVKIVIPFIETIYPNV
jgi:hypothetical protein